MYFYSEFRTLFIHIFCGSDVSASYSLSAVYTDCFFIVRFYYNLLFPSSVTITE